MIAKRLMFVGIVLLEICISLMRYKVIFYSDFLLGITFGLAIGVLIVSIIFKQKRCFKFRGYHEE